MFAVQSRACPRTEEIRVLISGVVIDVVVWTFRVSGLHRSLAVEVAYTSFPALSSLSVPRTAYDTPASFTPQFSWLRYQNLLYTRSKPRPDLCVERDHVLTVRTTPKSARIVRRLDTTDPLTLMHTRRINTLET
jgi:hypothetical protein